MEQMNVSVIGGARSYDIVCGGGVGRWGRRGGEVAVRWEEGGGEVTIPLPATMCVPIDFRKGTHQTSLELTLPCAAVRPPSNNLCLTFPCVSLCVSVCVAVCLAVCVWVGVCVCDGCVCVCVRQKRWNW